MKAFPVCVAVLLLAPSLLDASRLPIKTYTTADGLARDFVTCIEQDSRGFLWFCTAEGLSRFDGYQFANYHVEQGLPSNYVNDFLQTRQGIYWCATTGGLARFEPVRLGPLSIPPLPAREQRRRKRARRSLRGSSGRDLVRHVFRRYASLSSRAEGLGFSPGRRADERPDADRQGNHGDPGRSARGALGWRPGGGSTAATLTERKSCTSARRA